jgi:hypothetical protein
MSEQHRRLPRFPQLDEKTLAMQAGERTVITVDGLEFEVTCLVSCAPPTPPPLRRPPPAWRPRLVYARPTSRPRPRQRRRAPSGRDGTASRDDGSGDGDGDGPPPPPPSPTRPYAGGRP